MAVNALPLEAIFKHVPISSHVTIGDTLYSWTVLDHEAGEYQWAINGERWTSGEFDELPQSLKQYLVDYSVKKEALQGLEKLLRHAIEKDCRESYLKAWDLLCRGGNAFLKYCVGVVSDYHALDYELKELLARSAARAAYSSSSALLHVDCTGASGAGKNDIINKALALIPQRHKEVFTSTTPTAVYYNTLQRESDRRGNVTAAQSNPDHYRGKVIAITEVADSAGFTALKALAEIDERAEQTHSATVNGQALNMRIRGPRCVWTTSVEGVNDAQVKRRFIHVSVSEDTEDNKLEKIELITDNLLERCEIEDDVRTKVAQAGFDLLFSGDIAFEQTKSAAWNLIKFLSREFVLSGYSVTSIKQFHTLCECAAVEKRFQREYQRIEVEDVCEAWFLLSSFERETISKLSQNGVKLLEAIKTLTEEYDRQFAIDVECGLKDPDKYDSSERPTRKDIALESGVSSATVYRQLDTRNADRMGILIEFGYVNYAYDDVRKGNVYELTELGRSVLRPTVETVTVDGITHRPIDPMDVPDDENEDNSVLTILTDYHVDENAEN